jgi:hypothetical protein
VIVAAFSVRDFPPAPTTRNGFDAPIRTRAFRSSSSTFTWRPGTSFSSVPR